MRSLLLFPIAIAAACAAPADDDLGELAAPVLVEQLVTIQAIDGRCLTLPSTRAGFLSACGLSDQQFKLVELDDSHDVRLELQPPSGRCVAIAGATAGNLGPGQRLTSAPCAPVAAQRFAYDGDALLVGRQADGARVTRDFAIEVRRSADPAATDVVVGDRDVDDAEFWRITGNALPFAHSGFVRVTNESQFLAALQAASWGTVIQVDTRTQMIAMSPGSMRLVLPEGATLRADRRVAELGPGFDLPVFAATIDSNFLRLADHTRVTNLRFDGNVTDGTPRGAPTWALLIGSDFLPAYTPLPATDVTVDHVDVSHWAHGGIFIEGEHGGADAYACPDPSVPRPMVRLVANFIHHNDDAYGVVVADGGAALVARSLAFVQAHDVTASPNPYNRYTGLDNLFTSEENPNTSSSAVFDMHGNCNPDHYSGGRAGDFYEVAFNSYFTGRDPKFSIRGTPCLQAKFHDNFIQMPETSNSVNIEQDSPIASCPPAGFHVGTDSEIVLQQHNHFGVRNPLEGCPRRAGTGCQTGDLGVADLDGDNRDDLFLGTGVTWWYASGGTAEWRFLNRMPEVASDLRFGDFDGDGRADVIAVHGPDLDVSWGGVSPWFRLNSSNGLGIDDLAVGTFAGSSTTRDLFQSNGTQWLWSPRGTSPWQIYGTSSFRVAQLRFGDFDDQLGTDLIGFTGGAWQIVNRPGAAWQPWGVAQVSDFSRVVAGDFDGDNRTDLAWYAPPTVPFQHGAWKMAGRGQLTATTFMSSIDTPLVPQHIGRFDTVTGADVLRWTPMFRFLEIVSRGTIRPWSRQSMR